ncbi:MAG TPA: ABC transporter substrate-binding protein [Acidimicrobiales bacterium]|nr:ABC transporter substrate-binding protein [Acidimicrobiales bacterium]
MEHRRIGGRGFVGGLVVLALLATAGCGTSNDDDAGAPTETSAGNETAQVDSGEFVEITGVPGVTDEEIRFAALGTSTGNNPTGSCYLECFVDGVNAYFAYRNSEGGVLGRQLVLTEPIDDELGNNQQRSLEIVSADDVLGVFATPLIPAGFADLESAGIPVYTYLTTVSEAQRNNVFGAPFGTNCPGCVRLDQAYLVNELGATRVAALGYSVGSSSDCANAVGETIDFYSDALGDAETVYTNGGLTFGLPNGVAPEVTAMRDADVEVVFTCMDVNGVKAVAEEMKRQGMTDAVIVQNSSFDEDFIRENAAAYENGVIITNARPSGEGADGTDRALFEEWIGETGGTLGPEISVFGWYLAHLAVAGIEAAGAPFDRQSLIDATNSLQGFTANGLMPERNIADQHLVPDESDPSTLQSQPYCWVMYQVIDGEPQLFGEATPEQPWVCWPAPGQEYSDPELTNFS